MPREYEERFKNIEKLVQECDKFDVKRCLEDMDYEDIFPEDMCESRTDWEELKDRKEKAQRTVRVLLDIVDKLRGELCQCCMADDTLVEHPENCEDCAHYYHYRGGN